MAVTFETFAREVSKKVWGFQPDRDIKLVHFANGFFRALCNGAAQPSLVQKVAGGVRSGRTRFSNGQILHDLAGRFDAGEGLDADAVGDLRNALESVLNQDKGLFANGPYSLTLTHRLHVTSDPSDRGSGQFMAGVLESDRASEAGKTLRAVLNEGTDDIFLLTLPLLDADRQEHSEIDPDSEEFRDIASRVAATPLLRNLRAAFGNLASRSSDLDKTTLLQRAVLIGGFGLFLQLVNQTDGDQRPLVPILLCEPTSNMLMPASRATYARARQRIERAFEREVGEEMRRRDKNRRSEDGYKDLARSWLPNLEGGHSMHRRRDEQVWNQFQGDFDGHILGSIDPFEAFNRAATRASFEALRQSSGLDPEGCATALARRIGLVFPREGGRGDKYYRPTPEFLDMLVVALIRRGEEITLEEFWARARDYFGIVVGARSNEEAEALARWGIHQVSSVDLAANARRMLDELVRMGHAHEYADDIAMISVGGDAE